MAKKYIDADEFLKSETKRCGCIPLVGSCTTDNESLSYRLARAPTADVVEVVRCKDCEYAKHNNRCDALFCKLRKEATMVKAMDFCSYGERREDDDV